MGRITPVVEAAACSASAARRPLPFSVARRKRHRATPALDGQGRDARLNANFDDRLYYVLDPSGQTVRSVGVSGVHELAAPEREGANPVSRGLFRLPATPSPARRAQLRPMRRFSDPDARCDNRRANPVGPPSVRCLQPTRDNRRANPVGPPSVRCLQPTRRPDTDCVR
jgi:hypothetical protein